MIKPTRIFKTTYKVVVYSEEQIHDGVCGLLDVAESIDTGDNIGSADRVSEELITDPGQLRRELLEIGNDGEFFSHNELDGK